MKHIKLFESVDKGIFEDIDLIYLDLQDQGFRCKFDPNIEFLEVAIDSMTSFTFVVEKIEGYRVQFKLEDVIDNLLMLMNCMKKQGWNSQLSIPHDNRRYKFEHILSSDHLDNKEVTNKIISDYSFWIYEARIYFNRHIDQIK